MKFAITLAALGFVALSNAAFARAPEVLEMSRIDVPYADLNLRTPAGAEAMLGRIRSAAVQVCGGRPDIREVGFLANFRACQAAAVQNAVSELNVPMVSQLYFRAGGAPYATVITQR